MGGVTERALDIVGAHCDLESRLAAVPPSAALRGLYVRSLEKALTEAGRVGPYHELFGDAKTRALTFVPMHIFLPKLAVAGALLVSPERLHEGITELGRRNARVVSDSLIGRTLLRIMAPDPKRMLKQGCASQRQTTNYASWEVSFPEENVAEMRFTDEFVWLESYLVGAAHGTFEMVGMQADVEVVLEDRFNGMHRLRW